MKSIKTLVIVVVLGLAGIVYAAGGSRASTQSCGLNQAGCCVPGASCCTGDVCCTAHQAR